MSSRDTEKFVMPDDGANQFLNTLDRSSSSFGASKGLGARLSPRGYYRLLKTARTIADLGGEEYVKAEHLAEAFSYRLKEEV